MQPGSTPAPPYSRQRHNRSGGDRAAASSPPFPRPPAGPQPGDPPNPALCPLGLPMLPLCLPSRTRSAARPRSASRRPPPALGCSTYFPTLRPHPGLSALPRTPVASTTLAGGSGTQLPTPACGTHRKRRNLFSRCLPWKLQLSFLRSAEKSLRSQIPPSPPALPRHLCRSPHTASLMFKVVFRKGSRRRGRERPLTWEVHGWRG